MHRDRNKKMTYLLRYFFIILCPFQVIASELPASLQVVLLSKILNYEIKSSEKRQLSIYVLNNRDIYKEFNKLKKFEREKENTGTVIFETIDIGKELPNKKYDFIYFDDDDFLAEAISYSYSYHSPLITGNANLVEKGATLGMGVEGGKPKFYLNESASEAVGLQWQPQILSIMKKH